MHKEKEKPNSKLKEGRLETSQIDNRKIIERINKTKVGFVRRLLTFLLSYLFKILF